MMRELLSVDDMQAAFDAPLAILFKHSTQCPISAAAYDEMERFLSVHRGAPVYLVKVIEHRAVSDAIEKRTGIRHESPQVIILESGTPVWHASHHEISASDIENVLVDFR